MKQTKECRKCGIAKPLEAFSKRTVSADGLQPRCKVCMGQERRLWGEKNKARNIYHSVNSQLKKKFGITIEERDALLEAVDYKCEVCGQPERAGKNLAIDHNHKTGEIRGMLCMNCNTGLGSFYDDPVLLRSAADYVEISKFEEQRNINW